VAVHRRFPAHGLLRDHLQLHCLPSSCTALPPKPDRGGSDFRGLSARHRQLSVGGQSSQPPWPTQGLLGNHRGHVRRSAANADESAGRHHYRHRGSDDRLFRRTLHREQLGGSARPSFQGASLGALSVLLLCRLEYRRIVRRSLLERVGLEWRRRVHRLAADPRPFDFPALVRVAAADSHRWPRST